MTLHTSTFKGKRILIVMKDGSKIVDKFKDKKTHYILTECHGKIPIKLIKAMTICKPSGWHPRGEEGAKC